MKITRLRLVNFRAYEDVELSFDDNFSVVIGRNDVGKSTVLEALDIFLDGGTVSIDIEDLNVGSDREEMSIQVSFEPGDTEYTIDTVPTNLERELLLDSRGELTIRKTWDCSSGKLTASKLSTYMVSDYPKTFDEPLITLKIADLRKVLATYSDALDVAEVKKNKSSSIRQAIYRVEDTSDRVETLIPIDKQDGKKIWDALKGDLPMFFLFQSDRQNKDSDKEVQGPLKAITKVAISELEAELDEIKDRIRQRAETMGERTLEKLHEMNPEIADVLTPRLKHRAWDSLFSFSFESDDGIPINKRGSGVRRLILLNYFRAQAERSNTDGRSIVYAIEEPETSQHPDWQVELMRALSDLAEEPDTQVVLTTHSPSLAGLSEPRNLIFLKRDSGAVRAYCGSDADLSEVTDTLGVLPDVSIVIDDLQVDVVLCLEGPTDVILFQHFGRLFEIDIETDQRVLVLPLGGGTLRHWVNQHYLAKVGKPEVHIYDNDVDKYADYVALVNSRDSCWACLTEMREAENYIHPSLVSKLYNTTDDFVDRTSGWLDNWKDLDVPKSLSAFLKAQKAGGDTHIKGESQGSIKKAFAEKAAPMMTLELLEELDAKDEVEQWFDEIKKWLA